jgi:hypothetical protein
MKDTVDGIILPSLSKDSPPILLSSSSAAVSGSLILIQCENYQVRI